MEIKVIYGPPCSGKTTYVRDRLQDQDVVYDYDALINAMTNRMTHLHDKHIAHSLAAQIKYTMLGWLRDTNNPVDVAFLITTYPSRDLKKKLADFDNVRYIRMEATMEECLERLKSDDSCPDKDAWEQVIRDWFGEFEGKEVKGMTTKSKETSLKKADAAADIELVNRYSVKTLTPEEVYCFSVILCDNDVDRDRERFTSAALEGLAPLFLGKTGIMDHRWSAEGQIARLYRVETEDIKGKKNALGEPLRVLRGSAYMLKTKANQPIIDAIEGGILKEVSVGCAMNTCTCSVCGSDYGTCGHQKGERYDGGLCVAELSDPIDAYEFSFVAVPAQPGAGVTKSAKKLDDAFAMLMTADLSHHTELVRQLVPKLQMALADDAERAERATIRKNAEKIANI